MTSSRMNDVRFHLKVTPYLFIITFFYGIVKFRGSSNSELNNVIQFSQFLNEDNYHDSKNYEHTTAKIRTQKTGTFLDIVNNETTSTSDLQTTTPIPTIKLESTPRLEPSTTPERTAISSNKTEPNPGLGRGGGFPPNIPPDFTPLFPPSPRFFSKTPLTKSVWKRQISATFSWFFGWNLGIYIYFV